MPPLRDTDAHGAIVSHDIFYLNLRPPSPNFYGAIAIDSSMRFGNRKIKHHAKQRPPESALTKQRAAALFVSPTEDRKTVDQDG
jgi:hypothetical protein